MKTALKQGDAADLNIYSTSGAGYLGFAYYPSITSSNRYDVLDGIVIHYGSLPGGFIRNYNLGYTATHEVGHYLGLAAHVRAGLHRPWRLRGRHPGHAGADPGCPADKDTCPRDRARSDPQLHGLLVRRLLHGVHSPARRRGCRSSSLALAPQAGVAAKAASGAGGLPDPAFSADAEPFGCREPSACGVTR